MADPRRDDLRQEATAAIVAGRICQRIRELSPDATGNALANIIAGELWWGPDYLEAERRRGELQARLDAVKLAPAGES